MPRKVKARPADDRACLRCHRHDRFVGVNLSVLLYVAENEALGTSPQDVVATLFPRTMFAELGHASLLECGFPARGEVNVGVFERGLLVATRDAALFNPSKLHQRYLKHALGNDVYLLTQQPVYDMFAFAHWSQGHLRRSVSVNPVGEVWESIGTPAPFEGPFWSGERPAESDYPLPFHPLDMADAGARAVLGVQFEGQPEPNLLNGDQIRLHQFGREVA